MPEVYRADHVGSLLRPAKVKEARPAFRQGTLDRERLREIEDRAILGALVGSGLGVLQAGAVLPAGFRRA